MTSPIYPSLRALAICRVGISNQFSACISIAQRAMIRYNPTIGAHCIPYKTDKNSLLLSISSQYHSNQFSSTFEGKTFLRILYKFKFAQGKQNGYRTSRRDAGSQQVYYIVHTTKDRERWLTPHSKFAQTYESPPGLKQMVSTMRVSGAGVVVLSCSDPRLNSYQILGIDPTLSEFLSRGLHG